MAAESIFAGLVFNLVAGSIAREVCEIVDILRRFLVCSVFASIRDCSCLLRSFDKLDRRVPESLQGADRT
jgi:hypothetical protein